jgi:SecD/SecF fusion protein
MKRFGWKIFWCLFPVVLAGLIVGRAGYLYWSHQAGRGEFKFGVDLVGGTILVYEVEDPNKLPANYKPEDLAASLKKRIDPNDLYNVTIRPIGRTRVEIILPTGGLHQAQVEEAAWQQLLERAREQWGLKEEDVQPIGRGKRAELADLIKKVDPNVQNDDIEKFFDQNYGGGKARHLTEEQVERVKNLISRVGSLEFRILSNSRDDEEAIKRAEEYFDPKEKSEQEKRIKELDRLAREGKEPPPPTTADGQVMFTTPKGVYSYSWIELDKQERKNLGLSNTEENNPANSFWKQVAEARKNHKAIPVARLNGALLYSRDCQDLKLPREERLKKKYEYFILTRDPERDANGEPKAVTGKYLTNASEGNDEKYRPAVNFSFDTQGANLFYDLTSKNKPDNKGDPSQFDRFLAIVLDGKIVTAPTIQTPIRERGQISGGNFTRKEVELYVNVLRAGALPATLKGTPVSENTMGATLGADTIRAGTWSVGIAFVAILLFMLIYYRFAGFVACVALMANLLLTVGFMVAVQAAFTLPGLAGLVLMLGMAVDANVLIYERLREERDRGASLALALRNGYDRAFPTIIDTHLSSIFTAIVLYVVGNDQLKGFGISLTVGLVISLFTSLYMTRLMFDIWQAQGWLRKLSMFRLFSRPNIDFMAIRYYWFTATILLTVFGITVFLVRGKEGLNIDFNGGTLYGGRLTQYMDIEELRKQFDEARQKEVLAVEDVKQLDTEGLSWEITYRDHTTRKVDLPNAMTAEEVKENASHVPDYAVEQIFVDNPELSQGSKTKLFNLRTSEKATAIVQASVNRLLGDLQEKILVKATKVDADGKGVTLEFTKPASPAQVSTLLEREMRLQGLTAQATQLNLFGQGYDLNGRYEKMRVDFTEPVDQKKMDAALEAMKSEFASRPQPERLENFDTQLAQDTQYRAMYAILASWAAILLYLWFRFGNWTFGLATVICLIHDLFFTLGIIAFSHYVYTWWPGFANALLIQDFKIDLPTVAALLTLVGYSVNDTIVVFDRIREVRGKNPLLTPQMINDSVNQTLSRTLLTAFSVWLVVSVLYIWGGEGVHLFAFVMVVGVIVGTYSSIYIASPLLLIFGEGAKPGTVRERRPEPEPVQAR